MSRALARAGRAALVVLAAALGALGGVRWAGAPAPAPTGDEVGAPREYTSEELQIACLPYMRRTATSLEEAQTRVNALEIQIRSKQVEIDSLEQRMTSDGQGPRTVASALEGAQRELQGLRARLDDAIGEKAALLLTLARTERELDGTRAELAEKQIQLARSSAREVEAREATFEQTWQTFRTTAQLQVCESGNEARLGQCREIVAEVVAPFVVRFKDCLRSGAAIPELRKAARPDDRPPGISASLETPEEPLTRGWYVAFCDPDLPEAGSGGRR